MGIAWRQPVHCQQGHDAEKTLTSGYSNVAMGSRIFCVHCQVAGPEFDNGVTPDRAPRTWQYLAYNAAASAAKKQETGLLQIA